jgi:uncharacterized protein YndB with AHSA1/START domain
MSKSTTSETDRIERSILINATRSKVWRALANAEDFGSWFGVNLKGKTFEPGRRVNGSFTIEGHEQRIFDIVVEQVKPEHLFSLKWHPYAMDPKIDYEKEERTTLTLTLKETTDGTLLTVVESGFDKVPPERRFEASRMNTGGSQFQLENL